MIERVKYIVNILIVAMLLGAVAVGKDGRLLGHSVDELFAKESEAQTTHTVDEQVDEATRVISSAPLAKDVIGYGGRTPVKLYVVDGVVEKVVPEENDETPSFFREVINSGLFERWNGLPLEEVAEVEVDVVSGATYSSMAVIENVRRAAAYGASQSSSAGSSILSNLGLKGWIGIVVILMGVVISFVRPKNKTFITVQLALNVVVLGFWCGSFLSLTQLVSWLSNGLNLSVSLLATLLLVVVIIMPLFGKKGTYCYIHCPMGSAQELLGMIPAPKLKLGVKTSKNLGNVRYYILSLLLFLMWLGVGFDLINYEVFSAFLLGSASTFVLVLAVVFLVFSIFVTKPYCRFVCPTGALITMTQKRG